MERFQVSLNSRWTSKDASIKRPARNLQVESVSERRLKSGQAVTPFALYDQHWRQRDRTADR